MTLHQTPGHAGCDGRMVLVRDGSTVIPGLTGNLVPPWHDRRERREERGHGMAHGLGPSVSIASRAGLRVREAAGADDELAACVRRSVSTADVE